MAADTSRQTLLPQDSQPNNPNSVRDTVSHNERRHTKRVASHSHNWLRFRKQTNSKGIRASEKISDRTPAMNLRCHRLKLWLVLLYTIVTSFSWIVTCILCYRPIRLATYRDQGTFTKKQYEDNDWWTRIARVTNSIVSLITIPVSSTVCAKAAVAYCQTPPSANDKGVECGRCLL